MMKVVKILFREEAYGMEGPSVTVITTLNKKELEKFSNMFFDTFKHGESDPIKHAKNIKKKLGLTDEQLVIVKPDSIERFY